MRTKKISSKDGFTLIEVLMVIAILATLAAISTPLYQSYIEKVQIRALCATLQSIGKSLLAYEDNNGHFPETLAEVGLDRLDPWGTPLQYIPIRGKPLTGKDKVEPRKDKSLHPLNSDFDLWSMGPDGKTALPLTAKDSQDDIIRAGDGNFLGIAADY